MQNAEQAFYHQCAKVKPNSPWVCSAKTQPAHTLQLPACWLALSNTDLLGAFRGTHTPSQTEACFNNVFIYFFFISPLPYSSTWIRRSRKTQSVANTFIIIIMFLFDSQTIPFNPKILPQAKTHGPLVNMMQINLCFLITKSNLVEK